MKLTVGPGRLAQMQKHGWRNNLKALTTFILSLFLCAECGSVCFAERLLLAESGSQNLVFPAFLTSALPPEAAIEVIEC